MKLALMELVICSWIPRLCLDKQGMASWRDGGTRLSWRSPTKGFRAWFMRLVGFEAQSRDPRILPSAALMQPMSRAFVAKLENFAAQHEIPLVQFRKGQRKDDVMKEYLRKFGKDEGVVFIGKAQEKTPVFRTEKRR